ncbi:MAG: 50S ribosomal protein L11 methyltransferase [Desulfomonile tiedjei]|uniref:Ribosomal protein L11 methyltransferase n=1 Tax=Desulfomonile tiedjei TaxID=2358 RepID=A0A9D6UYT0_9BACT|nr:50S ribosomal protein L11 methyltransferase [Desulfomonile tiedjei]
MSNDDTTVQWMTLRISLPYEMADAVTNFCHEHGSGGVVMDEDRTDAATVTAYFPIDKWDMVYSQLNKYLSSLHEIFPHLLEPVLETSPLKKENWAILWQDSFHAMEIGDTLLVAPPWLELPHGERNLILIEPAEAFGTGTHETTQGCLVLLEQASMELKGLQDRFSLLDVGCGSGILAIAGVKLGASDVRAVDNDPVAVNSALKNLVLNRLENAVKLECCSLRDLAGPADVVTANLDPLTLLANRDKLLELSRRYLIVSGVPLDQWEQVRGLLIAGKTALKTEIIRAEWACGLFESTR